MVASSSDRRFRVWSAACSSGEEPYSIGILLSEQAVITKGFGWHLTATDISTEILSHAAAGVYDLDWTHGVPEPWFRRYFQLGKGPHAGQCRINSEIKRNIEFRNLNLFQPDYGHDLPFHVIFCRNVMIYFDPETKEALVNRLFNSLVPGGYLMIGHSESMVGAKHDFIMIQPAVFQRPE